MHQNPPQKPAGIQDGFDVYKQELVEAGAQSNKDVGYSLGIHLIDLLPLYTFIV